MTDYTDLIARLRDYTSPDFTRPVIAATAFKRALTEAEQDAVGDMMLRGQYEEAAALFDGHAVYRKE